MNTIIRIAAASLLGLLFLGFSTAGWSLGLGDARVNSFLDQPLEIEVELLTNSSDDLSTIQAGLASAADYELIGASRNDLAVPLGFSIEGAPGEARILVTSQLPVSNPVVRLIIEVSSASGRMLREYTLFLDPATIPQSAPAPARSTAPGSQSRQAAPADSAEARPETGGADRQRRGSFSSGSEYGPVQDGETLWRIASDWSRGSGLTVNQAMVAIQRNNPQAFSNGNINLLQRGAILRMPDLEQAASISSAEANSEVREQAAALSNRRSATDASTPLLVDENASPDALQPLPVPEQAPAEPPVAIEPEPAEDAETAMDQEMPPPAESADALSDSSQDLAFEPQLELVPPSDDSTLESAGGPDEAGESAAAPATEQLREELARKEEELINQQQQNEYLEQRLKELESQLARQETAQVEDQDLASMEDRLQQQRQEETQSDDESWFGGMAWLWIGLLVVVAVLAGWVVSRRGHAVDSGSADDALRNIQEEAEEVLKVLDSGDSDKTAVAPKPTPIKAAPEPEPVPEESDETVLAPVETSGKSKGKDYDEAELLDEESADPEIQLDLARAYISMGDKEAARVILDEVESNGTDAQKAEAAKMKSLL